MYKFDNIYLEYFGGCTKELYIRRIAQYFMRRMCSTVSRINHDFISLQKSIRRDATIRSSPTIFFCLDERSPTICSVIRDHAPSLNSNMMGSSLFDRSQISGRPLMAPFGLVLSRRGEIIEFAWWRVSSRVVRISPLRYGRLLVASFIISKNF